MCVCVWEGEREEERAAETATTGAVQCSGFHRKEQDVVFGG